MSEVFATIALEGAVMIGCDDKLDAGEGDVADGWTVVRSEETNEEPGTGAEETPDATGLG